jgi:hypothetical protein
MVRFYQDLLGKRPRLSGQRPKAEALVQVSHILVVFRERDGRSFLTGRLLAV